MYVVTIDQMNSRNSQDGVPELLRALKLRLTGNLAPRVPFSRSVGDEIQGVVNSPAQVYTVFRTLMRVKGWYMGVGVGLVNEPLPKRSADANGPAFIQARKAVDDAKKRRGSSPVSVRAEDTGRAAEVQALLRLLGGVLESRTAAAWEAVELMSLPDGSPSGLTQADAAAQLGISVAAVSRRLITASYDEERAVLPLVARLLDELNMPLQG